MLSDKFVAKFSNLHIINRRICQYYYGGDVRNVQIYREGGKSD